MSENNDFVRRGRPRKSDDELSSRSRRRRILEKLSSFRDPQPLPSVGDTPGDSSSGEISAWGSPVVSPIDPLNETLGSIAEAINYADVSISSVAGTSVRIIEKDELLEEDLSSIDASKTEKTAEANCSFLREEILEQLIVADEVNHMWGTLHFDCDMCLYCRCTTCDICLHLDSGNCVHCESCMFECSSEVSDDNFDKSLEGFEEESDEGVGDDIISEEDAINLSMKKDLADIFLKRYATHALINDILGFLNKHNIGKFPNSAETLLKTPSVVLNMRDVSPGQYWHCGITEHIIKFASKYDVTVIDVTASSDGVPIFNSAAMTFWPLTCSFNNAPNVYIIGVYLGT